MLHFSCLFAYLPEIFHKIHQVSTQGVNHLRKKWKRTVQGWVWLDTYLHLHGNQQLRIENCRKILEYNEVFVRLQTLDMIIEIWGTNLRVFDYNDSSMMVTGKISSLHLTEKS